MIDRRNKYFAQIIIKFIVAIYLQVNRNLCTIFIDNELKSCEWTLDTANFGHQIVLVYKAGSTLTHLYLLRQYIY